MIVTCKAYRTGFKDSIEAANRDVAAKLRAAIWAVGQVLLEKSIERVPKDTHALVSSASIREEEVVALPSVGKVQKGKEDAARLVQATVSGHRHPGVVSAFSENPTDWGGKRLDTPTVIVGYGGRPVLSVNHALIGKLISTGKIGRILGDIQGPPHPGLGFKRRVLSPKSNQLVDRDPHDYAVYVHEDLEKKHTNGETAKFLEIPLLTSWYEMRDAIRVAVSE